MTTMIKERLGLLFVLVGPGGVGKNTLMNKVLKRLESLEQLPTATTRPIRPTEKEGREHDFYTLEAFQHLIDTDALIEYQEVRPRQFYGVPRKTVEDAINEDRDMIADIEVLGASILGKHYAENTIQIFIAPTTMLRLETQMRERGTDEATIRDRMQRAQMEMTYAPQTDHLIVNDNLDHATDELYRIITAYQNDRIPPKTIETSYSVAVLPYGKNMILRQRNDQHLLSAPLTKGTKPLDLARRLIQEQFDFGINESRWSKGIQTENIQIPYLNPVYTTMPDRYHITYHYGYALDNQIPVNQAWEWVVPSANLRTNNPK